MNGTPRSIARPRGEPLQVLGFIVGGWLLLRVLTWHSPLEVSLPGLPMPPDAPQSSGSGQITAALPSRVWTSNAPVLHQALGAIGAIGAPVAKPRPAPLSPAESGEELPAISPAEATTPPARVVGKELLLIAALAHLELAPQIASLYLQSGEGEIVPPAVPGGPIAPQLPGTRAGKVETRWSGDGWLLARQGTNGPIAAGEPSYGRSQAGVVLRYRLAPSSGHRPVAYVRATRALTGPQENEVSAGFAARPLAGLPVSVAGEVRLSQTPAGREARPAAFAVTELPPARLPFVTNCLLPLSTHLSPWRSARVRKLFASDPAWGSVRQNAPIFRPAARSGSQRRRCASVPNFRIGAHPTELWTDIIVAVDAQPTAISSIASA